METINVGYIQNGKTYIQIIENKSVCCPFCDTMIIPQYIFAKETEPSVLSVFTQCTLSSCKQTFITQFFYNIHPGLYKYIRISPTALPTKKDFSEIIQNLSSIFVEIYNQSYAAEQINLNQICGTGYRKALEFLIKDYLISIKPEDQHESIKVKFLNNCIREDIENNNIKDVAARAVWLGNDETHYVRKWEDKDVSDLKSLINLAIHWIESEIQTKKLLEDMSGFR